MRPLIAFACLLASLATLPAVAHDFTAGALEIAHPWLRPGLPERPAAAYMDITNTGDGGDRLVAARSPAFGKIELHTVETDGDVMKMRPVETIALRAGETVRL